ncbi:MAG TPA: Gfo/Idh/MocA family oxidoreductase, partial [Opitutus sp.]|nr:Gfo/Idh/MocA family oxidoreductase [Opitutus sp.]
MNRRTFISSLAVASAALATRSRVFGAASPAPAKVGVIGCGWFGGIGLESMARQGGVEFVSLCDVNANHLAKTLQTVAKYQSAAPRTFANFRDMLGSQRHDIVIVATPDHWHALPALEAIQAGADVWLEKPVGVDVIEGEALVAAARKHQRVVQVNTQRRSAPFLATARDRYLRSGKLGPIGVVEAYCYLHNRPADVPSPTAAPSHLDYELWSGPAPLLPFRAPFEDRGWRAFMEYGNGV